MEEPLDPLWVAEKYKISIDDPKFWVYFANEAKRVIGFFTGLIETEETFRDLYNFEELECYKYSILKEGVCKRKCKKNPELLESILKEK